MENGDWGKCLKCGNALDMHYTGCPRCEAPQPENRKVLNFFKTARYIARQEEYDRILKNTDQQWGQKVLQQLDYPRNDSFVEIYPALEDGPSELSEYCAGLCNHFGIKTNEPIILEISW